MFSSTVIAGTSMKCWCTMPIPRLMDSSGEDMPTFLPLIRISPESGWYDQDANEWVIVLKGEAKVSFENGDLFHLSAGDYLNIPAHIRHKVLWTTPDTETIWLAVHYS